MKAIALLGGPKEEWTNEIQTVFKEAKKNGDLVIGVDRGSYLLEELGIMPDLAIGDFDSLKKEELTKIESNVKDIRYSNPVKDWTDSELMIKSVFAGYNAKSLTIYGATGGRIDHFLVNLFMFLNPEIKKYAEKVTLIDQQNLIRFFLPGHHVITKEKDYPYFGVASLAAIQNLNISKAKYFLENYSGDYPRVFASNEFRQDRDEFELDFDSGFISVIFSKDIDKFEHAMN
ncbi:thiamine diphosphokinase [Lactobacillus kalixensis]|uniref:Thiamine diphosphokinase n=1 Tax=Lactobacillus kalixensis DSM 16043 TaxID=1423763 RepID=A0A0R1UEJ6_9LACO|nr:thiamine diphosphokinase [Lactobacillus kalixensis]KRL89658.1 hypothetical protein FC46_GL000561 [Lactobacillus kalixensis DSM 16043]